MCHCLMTSGVGGADVADPAGAESIKCSVQVEHAAWRSNLENAHAANWQEWPLEAKAGRSQHSCMTRFLYVKDVEKVLLAAKPRFVSSDMDKSKKLLYLQSEPLQQQRWHSLPPVLL